MSTVRIRELRGHARLGKRSGRITIDTAPFIEATRRWVERAVIGLGLCPFAAGVYASGRVRFAVSAQRGAAALLEELRTELLRLQAADQRLCETTLLIHPWVLNDFLEFNDFLEHGDRLVQALGLEGELQLASFHPQYRFAKSRRDDPANFTNRSPYPTLHLLREGSVARALESIEDPASIYERNIAQLRVLGLAGWQALWRDAPP